MSIVGGTSTTTVTVGATTQTVTMTTTSVNIPPLNESYSLAVHVVDLMGLDAPDLTVKIIRASDDVVIDTSKTDPAGMSKVVRLPKGDYRIEVWTPSALQLQIELPLQKDSVITMQTGTSVLFTFILLIIILLIVIIIILAITFLHNARFIRFPPL